MFPIPPLPHLEAWPLPEEPPWLADSASVLQPKALLPTPRYCLPPPSYRPPRPPLFPVPPPGSCLLPPPPLPTCEGMISPHSWQDSSITPNNKNERWRRSSWTSGDISTSPPLPTSSYSYQRSGQARPRTLVEVPVHSEPSAVLRSDLQPTEAVKAPVNILQSRLDPTSRPFTPASYKSVASDSYEDTTNVKAMNRLKEVSVDFSYFGNSSDQINSEAPCEDSLSTSALSKPESNSHQGSIFADDPQVEDLKTLLPDLDNSIDELHLQDEFVKSTHSSGSFKKSLVDVGCNILPPPILPFASHWSGKSRPPLLPTPKNFPPYGPRTLPTQASIYEEVDEDSVGSLLLSNPILQFQIPSMKASSNLAPRSTYRKSSSIDMEEASTISNRTGRRANDEVLYPGTIRKQDVVGVLLKDHISSVEKKPRHSFSSLHSETIGEEVDSQDLPFWDPSFPVIKPDCLLHSHPVPDEYMVAKVVGGKLPPIKLVNCHTDLLFFLFYVWAADAMQMMAASLLFERGWRFHMVEKVWLARWPGVTPERKTTDWEEGLYQYFDFKVWRRIPGWFRLNYVQLAEKTGLVGENNPIPVLSRATRN